MTRRVVLVWTGAWECAAVTEMRSAARRRRVEACDIQVSSGWSALSELMNGEKRSGDIILRSLNNLLVAHK